MQIRDSDWADLGEIAPSQDRAKETEETLPSRLTTFRKGHGFAPLSTDDPKLTSALEYVPEEVEDLRESVEELQSPFD
jgi:hypothetical protein